MPFSIYSKSLWIFWIWFLCLILGATVSCRQNKAKTSKAVEEECDNEIYYCYGDEDEDDDDDDDDDDDGDDDEDEDEEEEEEDPEIPNFEVATLMPTNSPEKKTTVGRNSRAENLSGCRQNSEKLRW